MARILITCFGSVGDLFPYIALGKALQDRQHEVIVGGAQIFRQSVEAEGLPFCHIRCSLMDRLKSWDLVRESMQQAFDPVKGGETFIRGMMQDIEATYQDTRQAAQDVDFVISNMASYATPVVCKELNIPWLSTILAPMFFMSAYDPPILSAAPWLRSLNKLSPVLYRYLFKLIKKSTLALSKPLYELCDARQLPAPDGNPLFEGQYSPHGTLAMFPAGFAQAQPDWPVNTMVTGFPLFSGENADPTTQFADEHADRDNRFAGDHSPSETRTRLEKFLQAGEPPLVFALGTSAVHIGQDFFRTSAAIARKLKRRAVLVVGPLSEGSIEENDDLLVIRWVPYNKLFPHASVIIHQAGIGTLAQAICAQKPMLIVPFGFDQFDNAERMVRLGVAASIKRKDYTVENASALIERLATEESYKRNAREVGEKIKNERGIDNACNEIESILNSNV